jgi:hypothetical protein
MHRFPRQRHALHNVLRTAVHRLDSARCIDSKGDQNPPHATPLMGRGHAAEYAEMRNRYSGAGVTITRLPV